MFFNGWTPLVRVLIVGILAYVALIAILRISGKRTLAKMNAFDLIVTVALGSTLATILLSKDVALLEGVTALALLIGLQYIIAWLSVRSEGLERLVKAEPALLFHQGQFLESALYRERVTRDEVRSAVRAQGIAAMEDAEAVVLETDGTFTVLRASEKPATALQGVKQPSEGP